MRNYYRQHLILFSFILATIAFGLVQTASAAGNAFISQILSTPNASIWGASVQTAPLSAFYRGKGTIWTSSHGLTPQGERALEVLSHAEDDGLKPEDYNANIIAKMKSASSQEDQAKLDILLSHGLLRYVNDLRYGRDSAERRETYGTYTKHPISSDILNRLAKTSPDKIPSLLATYSPPFPEYQALRKELQRYRGLNQNKNLPQLTFYRLLQLHNNVPAVKSLREILVATGDLTHNNGSETFDEELDKAVKQFQQRHGIDPDGVVGRETRQALNIPPQTRINSIIATMERLRWIPENFGKKYVVVNLPGYSLRAVRPGAKDLTMKIIVGKTARQTPTFIRSISQVIFNPTWTVPPRIAAEDILGDIKKYPEFFDINDFKLLKYNADGGTYEVNPKTINWSTVNQKNFNWTLYQPPGEFNPLGRVKFYIPNTPQVYMHDTPRKNLFSDSDRNLSSGCIRLELPKSFANYVLAGESGWTTEKVYKTFDTTKNTQYVPVRNQPTLYFVYWTATLGVDGAVYFHEDIYGRDKALLVALGYK